MTGAPVRAVLLSFALVAACLLAGAGNASAALGVKLLPLPGGTEGGGREMAVGGDGRLWFTTCCAQGFSVGAVTSAGSFTEYGGNDLTVGAAAAGPDGAVYALGVQPGTFQGNGRIVRYAADGGSTVYTIPEPTPDSPGEVYGELTSGPDGDLWFTAGPLRASDNSGYIGRMAPAGGTLISQQPLGAGADPVGITTGPDGGLWFADAGRYGLGRITTGQRLNFFGMKRPRGARRLEYVAAGRAKLLWFLDAAPNSPEIGWMTTSGKHRTFRVDCARRGRCNRETFVGNVAEGSDGDAWYELECVDRGTCPVRSGLWRMSTDGRATRIGGFADSKDAGLVAAGRSRDIWFQTTSKAGRMYVGHVTGLR